MRKNINVKDVDVAIALLNTLKDNNCEAYISYDVDVEKEINLIKGNIGDALTTHKNNGKDSSFKKSLKVAKQRINFLLDEDDIVLIEKIKTLLNIYENDKETVEDEFSHGDKQAQYSIYQRIILDLKNILS